MPHHPDVSPTAAGLPDSVFQALSRKLRDHVGPLYRLSVGDTWMEPLAAARCEALLTDDLPMLHAYAPPQGEPSLLDAIEQSLARRLSAAGSTATVQRDHVQVVSGATGGLSNACQTILDAGDEVVIPSPYWPLIPGIVSSRGGQVVEVPFWTRLGDPSFDAEAALESVVTPRTVAVYVNSPNNPTGRVLGERQADAVARFAARHDLWILSDDVYEDLWYGDSAPTPLWTRPDCFERTIATHSLSKAYGLAGARVGYTHGPREVMRALRNVQTHQAYCAPKPMQVAAARAMTLGDEWLARTRRAYADAAAEAARALDVPVPQAGTFVFFDAAPWLAPDGDVLPFLERCIDAGVLLTPGIATGRHHATWVRACFTTVAPPALTRALDRLRSVLHGDAASEPAPSPPADGAQRLEGGESCCE